MAESGGGGGCCPPMDLMRSETMQLVQLIVPMESAHLTVSYLGDLGLVQFKDVRTHSPSLYLSMFLLTKYAIGLCIFLFPIANPRLMNNFPLLDLDFDGVFWSRIWNPRFNSGFKKSLRIYLCIAVI